MPYSFELPKDSDLSKEQSAAMNEPNCIALSGGPGTGKTVVSIYRLLRLVNDGRIVHLITFTKILTSYIRQTIECEKKLGSDKVFHTTEWLGLFKDKDIDINEIILDEAQDNGTFTFDTIKSKFGRISYGADANQYLEPDNNQRYDIIEELRTLFPQNIEYTLFQNYRNTYYILLFVKSILHNFFIPENTLAELKESKDDRDSFNRRGEKPKLYIWKNGLMNKRDEKLKELFNMYAKPRHNIGIIVEGKYSALDYQCLFNNYKITQNNRFDEIEVTSSSGILIGNVHITTIKGAKGLEFDTVIIPDFGKIMDVLDSNGRRGITNEEDYYVALTRAKQNLILISPEFGTNKKNVTSYIHDFLEGDKLSQTYDKIYL